MIKILYILLIPLLCYGEEFVVVMQKSSALSNLSQAKVKMIFLKKQKMSQNLLLVPINLPPSSSIRKSFEKQVLRMSRNRLKSFWTKEHYLGHRPPLTMKSSRSTLSFVEKIDGAIGYIPSNQVNNKLKILYKWKSK